ncbi:MAG: hypothetical protein JW881_19330 [Spirochaetales bacterium]|nr:hypothetical protein [Spirochaetales bacterium]
MKKTITGILCLISVLAGGIAWGDVFDPKDGLEEKNGNRFFYRVRGNSYKMEYVIKGIAVPSSLEQGDFTATYTTVGGGSPDGSSDAIIETISGPGKHLSCDEPYNGWDRGLIQPRYINGTYPSYNIFDADPPCIYPFTIHVYVPPAGRVDETKKNFEWLTTPQMRIKIAKGNLKDPTTIKNYDYNSYNGFEFDLNPGEYAMIRPLRDGRYEWEDVCVQEIGMFEYEYPCTRKEDVVLSGCSVYFALDTVAPELNDAPGIKDAVFNNNIYYTNESSLDTEDGVTIVWHAIEDEGTFVCEQAQETSKSGMASYRIYEAEETGSGNEYTMLDTIEVMDDGNGEQIPFYERTLRFDEGRHTLLMTACDKRGLDSRYVYDENGKLVVDGNNNPTQNKFSEPCIVVVDRTPPAMVTGVKLEDEKTVETGTGTARTYAVSPAFTLEWDESEDMPDEDNAGTENYTVRLRNITDSPAVTETTYDIPVSEGEHAAIEAENGVYEAAVRAVDAAGNEGAWSDTYTFSIDSEAPVTPAPASFTMESDPFAIKSVEGETVSFSTTNADAAVSFTAVSDGTEAWQSGIASYTIEDVHGTPVQNAEFIETDGRVTMTFPDALSGTNAFTVYAADKAGNRSGGVTLTITVTALSSVTFPAPCYEYDGENDEYSLLWTPPDTVPEGAEIAYYKALFRTSDEDGNMDSPKDEAFAPIPEMTETRLLLDGIERGVGMVVYILVADTYGNKTPGKASFTLPPMVIDTVEDYVLNDDEYWWSGVHEMHANVIVPEGFTLTILPGTIVITFGNVKLQIEGSLVILGEPDQEVTFEAASPSSTAWQGIYLGAEGTGVIRHAVIQHALRGMTVVTGAGATVFSTVFFHNRVGLHSYGAAPSLDDCRFEECQWYGVKEDAVRENGGMRPALNGCGFKNNGCDYYHEDNRDITMEELNDIPGNGNNGRVEE